MVFFELFVRSCNLSELHECYVTVFVRSAEIID